MSVRTPAFIGGLVFVVAAASMTPAPAAGQTTAPAAKATPTSSAKAWTAKTPDGQPDLQGVWTNATITPFERPTALGAKAVLSEEEAAELEKRAAVQRQASDEAPARR